MRILIFILLAVGAVAAVFVFLVPRKKEDPIINYSAGENLSNAFSTPAPAKEPGVIETLIQKLTAPALTAAVGLFAPAAAALATPAAAVVAAPVLAGGVGGSAALAPGVASISGGSAGTGAIATVGAIPLLAGAAIVGGFIVTAVNVLSDIGYNQKEPGWVEQFGKYLWQLSPEELAVVQEQSAFTEYYGDVLGFGKIDSTAIA